MVAATYVALLFGVVAAMSHARAWVIATYGDDAARQQWQKWVQEAERQATGQGPVKRAVPASAQPPALIMMRDHFPACLTGVLILSSCVFATTVFFVWGAVVRGV